MSAFKVGDVCEGVGFIIDTNLNGVECIVTQPLEMRMVQRSGLSSRQCDLCYVVEWANGSNLKCPYPHNLRLKRRPNKDEPITDFVPCEPEFFQDLMKRVKQREGV